VLGHDVSFGPFELTDPHISFGQMNTKQFVDKISVSAKGNKDDKVDLAVDLGPIDLEAITSLKMTEKHLLQLGLSLKDVGLYSEISIDVNSEDTGLAEFNFDNTAFKLAQKGTEITVAMDGVFNWSLSYDGNFLE
jgi:hypothetical protein